MKNVFLLFVLGLASFQFLEFKVHAQVKEPLTLIQTIELPEVPTLPFAGDLFLDMKGHRLFAAMQGAKSLMAIDVNTGKVIHKIPVEYPHTVLYLEALDQIYVTDQGSTEPGLKIFDARDYHLVKTLKLQARADAGEYDPHSKLFYVDNGGAAAKLDYSLISIIDTTTGELVGDIKIPAKTLEAMVLEGSSSRLYVNIRDKDQVALVDRDKRTFLEAWTITKGKSPAAIALDEKHHRLFVGCRSSDMHGHIVVFDTQTGHEVDALPIGGMVDDLVFDAASGQLYAACGSGEVDVYQQRAPDDYVLLGKAVTGIMARSGLLVPELHRYYVSVPSIGTQSAKILVYRTQ